MSPLELSRNLAIALACGLALAPAAAGADLVLLRSAAAARGPTVAGEGILRQRFVDVDRALLHDPAPALAGGSALLVELFPDTAAHLRLLRAETAYGGGRVAAFAIDEDPAGEAIISIVGDAVTSRVLLHRRLYEIRPTAAQDIVVVELDPLADGGCATADVEELLGSALEPATASMAASASSFPFQIDVMVPYTQQVRISLGSEDGVLSLINACVFAMNQGLAESDVIARVQLVRAVEVSLTDDGSWTLGDFVAAVTDGSDGAADEIPVLRDACGADLVCVLFENAPSGGGSGKAKTILCWDEVMFGTAAADAYAVARRANALASFSFSHELGHLLGAHHDVGAAGAPACTMTSAPFGVVTVPSGDYRTIMAYQPAGGHSVRINMWSTPAKNAPNGESLGYAGSILGIPAYMNNVAQLNVGASFAAAYRTSEDFGHELATSFDGAATTRGCMFDLTTKNDLDLTGITLNVTANPGASVSARVWYFEHGSYLGHESDVLGWKQLAHGIGTAAGAGNETYLELAADAVLLADRTYGLYVDLTSYVAGKHQLRVTVGPPVTFDNQDLHLETGVAKDAFFGAATTLNRNFNGILHYRGASGERELEIAPYSGLAYDGLFFRVEPKRDVRLHCLDVHLLNAEPAMIDVWMAQQVPLTPGASLASYDWVYLGTDTLAAGHGPDVPERLTVPHVDLAAGVDYVFYVHLAGNGLFGQKLLAGGAAASVENEDLLVWDGAVMDGAAFTGALVYGARPAGSLHYTVPGPYLVFENFHAPGVGTIRIQEAIPGDTGWLLLSSAGPGPMITSYGYLHVDGPFQPVNVTIDGAGEWQLTGWIPPSAAGLRLWGHAFLTKELEFTSAAAVEID